MTLVDDGKTLAVSVEYNAAHDPFWAFAMLGPMPSTIVRRSGAVLAGGF
jgi:hypothetical protein